MTESDTAPAPVPEASPFHAAEIALQERFGRRARLEGVSRRSIRDHLIEQHRTFFPQLPFLLVGSVDATGQPWASMLAGRPGFVWSPDPRHLRVDARPLFDDPLKGNLVVGMPFAVLGIELPTRRRNRMNGRLVATDERGFTIEVQQSFGNCPQYIQARDLFFLPESSRVAARGAVRLDGLTDADSDLLSRADTFFIATANLGADAGFARGTDVSHRGGRAGFIRIDDRHTITTPDFLGNFFFNTLGNLTVEPRAGLLFADFDTGDLLLATARAEIIWDGPEVESFAGAQRLVRFHLTQLLRLARALPFRGSAASYARELARTGTWQEAAPSRAQSQAEALT